MDKYIKMYEPILREFERIYPHIATDIVEWYPSGQFEIVAKNSKGIKYAYSMLTQHYRILTNEDMRTTTDDIDEETWRNKFSYLLRDKLYKVGCNQEWLSENSGISMNTISKYLNGKATPSGYNIERLARALKCSVTELTEML